MDTLQVLDALQQLTVADVREGANHVARLLLLINMVALPLVVLLAWYMVRRAKRGI